MSARYYNFREGDRSELLADYLLSGIGITTPIRRQDDTGFDFYCSISDQEKGVLTFGFPFIIQIKSKAGKNIISYGTDIEKDWESHQVEWLFRNELPLFFGIVNKSTQSIEIYDCSAFYFSKSNRILPAKVEFIPRADKSDFNNIDKPEEIQIPNWTNDLSNGKIYKVDMGHPIITLQNSDFDDDTNVKKKKDLLRQAISIQSSNLNFFRLRLPYLNWIVNNKTNDSLIEGWSYFIFGNTVSQTEFVTNMTAEALISIGIHAFTENKQEIIESIRVLLKYVNIEKIPSEIKIAYPKLFE